MLASESLHEPLSVGVLTEKEDGGLGERPLEVSIADFVSGGSFDLAGRGPGAPDEPGVGRKLSDRGKPLNVVDLVEDGQGEHLPDARDGSQKMEELLVMSLGLSDYVELEGSDGLGVELDEGEVGVDGPGDAGVIETIGGIDAVLPVHEGTGEGWQVALSVEHLNVSEEFGPLSHEVEPPAEEIACGAHVARIDVGLGDHAATQKYGDLMGVNPVVLCLSAVDRFHVKGVTEDEGDGFGGAEIGEPVPGEHTFGGDDDIVTERSDGLEEGLGCRLDLAVEPNLTIGIQHAEIERSRVEIDATVVAVGVGVESHEASSFRGS